MTSPDFIRLPDLQVHPGYREILEKHDLLTFHDLYGYSGGALFKKNRFRSVVRITLQDSSGKDHVFHLKRHHPPIPTRLKSIFTGLTVRDGAENEWEKILRLEEVGIHTMTPVAFGVVRKWGFPYRALTLTEHLYGAEKLEDYLPEHFGKEGLRREEIDCKRRIIIQTARWAAKFHNAGFHHQDFYLGHIFIRPGEDGSFMLHLIDLQRVRECPRTRLSRVLKDLAQINFSALQLPCLTRADRMRFIHAYLGRTRLAERDRDLIRKVESKTGKIVRHTIKLLKRRGLDVKIRGHSKGSGNALLPS